MQAMTVNKLAPLYPRQIRSYSCRETRLDMSQKQIFEREWPHYGLKLEPGQMLNFDEIFGRSAPRVLEIGFGDGASLLAMAKACPEKDFIGIEVYRRGIARLLAGILKESLTNIRIILKDAVEVLEHYIPDQSLKIVQIYFADPWPKTRHHKRRLIQTDLIELVSKKLTVDGIIHCATDWENYAQHMMAVLLDNKKFRNIADKNNFIERPNFRPLTKYEKRATREGRSIFDLMFERF
jgi:tRNA (guanine-N7-)-methyltransferase